MRDLKAHWGLLDKSSRLNGETEGFSSVSSQPSTIGKSVLFISEGEMGGGRTALAQRPSID